MSKLPLNVWVIAAALSLTTTGVAALVFIGGLIGAELTETKQLATLPIAALVVGNALFSVPAVIFAKRLGRKAAAYCGFVIAFLSSFNFVAALYVESIYLFSFGGFLIGFGMAFFQQFRFAAIESLDDTNDTGLALSIIMLSSIAGVFVGPELASLGKNLLPGMPDYSGSFVLYAVFIVAAMLVFLPFKNPKQNETSDTEDARPISRILLQQGFIIAVASGAIGFAVMSFLMTSTPLSMHAIDSHNLTAAKWVIQSHLIAMYLPSLFSGYLIKAYGPEKIMLAGGLIYLAVIAIGLSGQNVIHYWWALVLLGVGWNFLFLSGTALLPRFYKHNERFRAQGINEFCVFSLQACASLSAGWVLFEFGWVTQIWLCLAPCIILVVAALVQIQKPGKN